MVNAYSYEKKDEKEISNNQTKPIKNSFFQRKIIKESEKLKKLDLNFKKKTLQNIVKNY